MRTEITERTLYKFDELSDEAKDHAHDRWISGGHDNPWADDNRASLDAFAEVFPVKVTDWRYDSCNGHATTRCTADDDICQLSGTRLRTYLLNNYYPYLFGPKTKYYTKDENGKRRMNSVGTQTFTHKSKIFYDRASCPFTGYCVDDDIMDPIHKFLDAPSPNTTFEELLQECADAWIQSCVNDLEHSTSMEYFEEHAEANDYEFTEDGELA